MSKRKLMVALFAIAWLAPLGMAIGYSFLYSLGLAGVLQDGFTFSYWAGLFQGEFLQSILYSAWVAGASTILVLLTSLGMLFLFRRQFSNRTIYNSLFLPLAIPPIVLAFSIYQLLSGSGLLSRAAYHMNLITEASRFPALVQDPWAIGIILAHLFLVFPFFLLISLKLYEHQKLEELGRVASTLGASTGTILFQVQLPILLRGLSPLIALYFIFFMGAYEIPLILGESSPQMISILILEKLQRFNLADIPVAHSMAVWYAILCIATIAWLFSGSQKKVFV
ncbi:ABC transporter permease subunit [Rhodohalobacter mucosus]|uniref:ABC transporter permease n=1 Tax=Rhodohalobacter mucosus TaxID=2079485 RepID=A0A316TZ84_9BACT|nr:ABC transporter permease subunit [Rhodohalobacter mucosus]PWN05326.1 ABC transporter permease [Rhodohalobacter mucosus]